MHLLDGDLKVRDEFGFDKSQLTANSKESMTIQGSLDPESIKAMIQILKNQLQLSDIQKQNAQGAPPSGVPERIRTSDLQLRRLTQTIIHNR